MEARDRIARRFPLVARARPVCPALDVRVRELCDLARAAASAIGSDRLPLAAAAHNKAALIASDCGMSELARSLCWRHHHAYLRDRPLSAQAARFALEPLVNLARLMIRCGDGEGAHRLLEALYQAVASRADAVIDGTSLSFRDLTGSTEAHHTVCRWLWTVLLADGTRALTVAGRWEQALAHAQQHSGIGLRLLDGRQVAILAHCLAGDAGSGLALLTASAMSTSWERCIAACLTVLCLMSSARPAGRAITEMVEQYVGLEESPGLVVFHCRLGLTVIDLADGIEQPEAAHVAARVVSHAMAAGDGYSARDVLTHAGCRDRLAVSEERVLSATIQSAGLGRGEMPTHLIADLLTAVDMSERVMTQHLPLLMPGSRT